MFIRAIRSYLLALPASRQFGRANRLRDQGRNELALATARGVLERLHGPRVVRTNPAEAALIMCSTVLVEELARELKQPGADVKDISDAVTTIREVGDDHYKAWIPYLEWRLNQGATAHK